MVQVDSQRQDMQEGVRVPDRAPVVMEEDIRAVQQALWVVVVRVVPVVIITVILVATVEVDRTEEMDQTVVVEAAGTAAATEET